MKKIFARSFFFASLFVIVAAFITIATAGSHVVRAQTSYALTGYAWSDNIGWISFSGSNPNYGITEDASGNLTGYAWSDAIGWIKFGGLSGFPSGPGTSNENALIDSNGTLHGWARACAGTVSGDCSSMVSRTDGWDGWISLDGAVYGTNFSSGNGQYAQSAWAWGSDVVGWITFNPSNLTASTSVNCNPALEVCGPGGGNDTGLTPTVNLIVTPTTIATGTAATLTWTSSNVTSCTESSTGSGIPADSNWNAVMPTSTLSTGNKLTSVFSGAGTETYNLTCIATTQAGGGSIAAAPATLTVTTNTPPPGTGMCTSVPGNATLCSGSAAGNTTSSLVSSCSATGGAPLCQYICSAGYHQEGNQCVANGTIQEE